MCLSVGQRPPTRVRCPRRDYREYVHAWLLDERGAHAHGRERVTVPPWATGGLETASPERGLLEVAGAGFEPATFGL